MTMFNNNNGGGFASLPLHFEEMERSMPSLPDATESYTPISHSSIIERIREEADKRSLTIVDRFISKAREGNQIVGKYYMRSDDNDTGYQIAFANSYDKSVAVKFAAGSCVFICLNGMITSDRSIVYARRHRGSGIAAEIDDNISLAFDKMLDNHQVEREYLDSMKDIPVDDSIKYDLVGKMLFEHSIITITQLSILVKEHKSPSFDYGVDKGSLYQFYNNVTHALKRSHPSHQIEKHIQFDQFIRNEISF